MIIRALGPAPISVDSLVDLTGASPATIRRDLTDLEGHGQLRKVHGGAVSVNLRGAPLPYHLRAAENADAKVAIAKVINDLVVDDMAIILDNGSTMAIIAEALRNRPITALCLSLRSALPLADAGTATVVTPGGTVMPETFRYEATACLQALHDFRADMAIVGTCAAAAAHGLTVTTYEDAQIKRSILATSSRVTLAATGEKLTRTSSFRFGNIEDVDDLVTTSEAPDTTVETFRQAGTSSHIAD